MIKTKIPEKDLKIPQCFLMSLISHLLKAVVIFLDVLL